MKICEIVKKLRKHKRLNQSEFGKLIGLGQQAISAIENGTSSGTKPLQNLLIKMYEEEFESIDETLRVAEIKPDYEPHGGWEPQTKAEDWGLMGMTHRVLTSQSIYSQALGANIRAFHHALDTDKKLTEQDAKLKEQDLKINDLIDRNTLLTQKCDDLVKRIEELEARLSGESGVTASA